MPVESATVSIEPLLVDVRAAAKMLSVSPRHLLGLHSSGRLGPLPVRLGRRTLWRAEELRDWVRAGSPGREIWVTLQGSNEQKLRKI